MLLPVLAAAVVLLAVYVVEPVTIGSDSMAPTLVAGQRVVLDKLTLHLRDPKRGDLVAFHAPGNGTLTLKRVVGLPGDTVAIRDGVLYVNGSAPPEPYVRHADVDSVYYGPTQVPAATVFVLGDNRGNSIDSRAFGPVAQSHLVGRVLWRF
jgi:signal peptidase I